jgi:hypothetical protein
MRDGNFQAGIKADPWQIIPTEWIERAFERWNNTQGDLHDEVVSVGVDPARGGSDSTVICLRFRGDWVAELAVYDGAATPDSGAVVSHILNLLLSRNTALPPVHVDSIGIGAAVVDALRQYDKIQVIPVNVSEKTNERDKTGLLRFKNRRAALWWKMREALDPDTGRDIALPPDPQLKAELASPRWRYESGAIRVEEKEEIRKRIGRSTDRADAVLLALVDTIPRAASAALKPRVIHNSQARGAAWMR